LEKIAKKPLLPAQNVYIIFLSTPNIKSPDKINKQFKNYIKYEKATPNQIRLTGHQFYNGGHGTFAPAFFQKICFLIVVLINFYSYFQRDEIL